MSDDLLQLHRWADGLLAKLSPGQRTQLAREIARSLRQSQSRRITAQQNRTAHRSPPENLSYAVKRARYAARCSASCVPRAI